MSSTNVMFRIQPGKMDCGGGGFSNPIPWPDPIGAPGAEWHYTPWEPQEGSDGVGGGRPRPSAIVLPWLVALA